MTQQEYDTEVSQLPQHWKNCLGELLADAAIGGIGEVAHLGWYDALELDTENIFTLIHLPFEVKEAGLLKLRKLIGEAALRKIEQAAMDAEHAIRRESDKENILKILQRINSLVDID